jgi:hypothetical protein
MKLAIIGHSPLALEAAIRFHLHGAALTWYIDQDDFTLFSSSRFSKDAFTSDLGLGILKEINHRYMPQIFSWKEWVTDYQKPLVDFLRVHQEVKTDEVVYVSKRFLAPGEQISGRSRFLDLFRVIYHVDPKDFIEDQKESNPDTYKRLTEEFINSLASSIEMYQDYDLVLDFRSDLSKASAAISGRALGEGRESTRMSYALDALRFAGHIPSDIREIAIIGSDSLAAELLISLSEWLRDKRSSLFVITTEDGPFEKFLKNADDQTSARLRELLTCMEEEFEDDVKMFSQKLRNWQELDHFVQAKIPKPVEPIPRLNFFSGHNVSAIDELIDRKRMFVTLERPDFRHGKKHPENNKLDLKTVGVDHILVAHSRKDMQIVQLDSSEQGYFNVIPSRLNEKDSWENDLLRLEGIEDEIFKLFSPLDSH